jgi:predicted nucleic acid-binding protein
MIVVCDTTAVTTLIKAGMQDLLKVLFGSVTVPQAVWEELLAYHPQLPDFVLLRRAGKAMERLPETLLLGRGEAEAITLARGINADLLVTDDLKARNIAAVLNVKYTGLLGLLILAKQRDHISSVKEAIATLEMRGGLYLSETVKAEAVRLAGEHVLPN